ncbi:MAG TPA: toprim domain-containing protein, partial [Plasticicumulans sp.]|nr:toprim domain-containing protein [Plasticicumulans sp.]
LALGEGLETVLACRCADPTLPVWSALTAGGVAAVVLPVEAHDVLIVADHDPRPQTQAVGAGQRAAVRLARRLRAEGRAVRIALPVEAGSDFADVLAEVQP